MLLQSLLSAALDVPSSEFNIINVYAGSTVVEIKVSDSLLNRTVNYFNENPSFMFLNQTVNVIGVAVDTSNTIKPSSTSASTGAVAGGTVGGVCVVVVILVLGLVGRRRRQEMTNAATIESAMKVPPTAPTFDVSREIEIVSPQ